MALLVFARARSRVASVAHRTIPEQPPELALAGSSMIAKRIVRLSGESKCDWQRRKPGILDRLPFDGIFLVQLRNRGAKERLGVRSPF